MKFYIIFFGTLCLYSGSLTSQLEKAYFEVEKTTFKYSLNTGVYKSRLSGANERENSFKNFSIFAQVYFPFKRALDTPNNFQKSEGDSTYFERLFSVCPVAVLHVTEKGGNALGMGQELSFKITNNFL